MIGLTLGLKILLNSRSFLFQWLQALYHVSATVNISGNLTGHGSSTARSVVGTML